MLQLDGLMAHQQAAVSWLIARPRAALAWDMRVGKTAAALRAWENTIELGPALVLCPATARENWRREALRFAIDRDMPPNVQVIKSNNDVLDPASDLVICNYDKIENANMIRKLRNNTGRGRWGVLINDEAHRLKNPNAICTRLVLGGARGMGSNKQTPLIELAERVWELSGTFMPNHPAELWTHCFYLWPEAITYRGRPMELWEFELHYCQLAQTPYGMKVVGAKNLPELKTQLEPFVNRLRQCDVGIPAMRIDTWPLDMETINGRAFPDLPQLKTKLTERFGDTDQIDRFDNATLDAYLQTINAEYDALASLRHATGTLKAVATVLLVREELEDGGPKTILFAQHREAIETLVTGFKAYNPAVIHGGITPGARRDDEVDRFTNDPTCRVFVGQIKAAGENLDLSAGSSVIIVEPSWVPGENAQAMARASGPRQKAPVYGRYVYLAGSIDENVVRANARKTSMIQQVFN